MSKMSALAADCEANPIVGWLVDMFLYGNRHESDHIMWLAKQELHSMGYFLDLEGGE